MPVGYFLTFVLDCALDPSLPGYCLLPGGFCLADSAWLILPALSCINIYLDSRFPDFVTSLDPGLLATLPGFLSVSVASCLGVWLCLKRASVIQGNEQDGPLRHHDEFHFHFGL